MNLIPPHDRYIISEIEQPTEVKTPGGLILPTASQPTSTDSRADIRRYKVVSRGPGLWNESGSRQLLQYFVGQEILAIKPQEIDGFDWEGARYYVIAETDVIAGIN